MKISRTEKKKLLILLVITMILAPFVCSTKLRVVHYEVKSDKVTAPVRLALITDLHSCRYGKGEKKLLLPLFEQQPDIILYGGDIADDVLPHENAFSVMQTLAKSYPSYYVSGNHEYWSGEFDKIKRFITDCGITVLQGQCATLTLKGQTLNICGVDDPEFREKTLLGQVKTAYGQANPTFFTLLLTHRPEYIHSYLDYDFDLILSGHVHGGQWRLPGIINGLLAPHQGFFPKYAGGRYDFGKQTFIVSRGLAKWSTRIPRIFNRPELVIIDVVPETTA